MKKKLPVILIILLTAVLIAAFVPMLVFAEDTNIKSDKPIEIKAYTPNEGGKSAHQVNAGSVYGIHITMGAPFNGVAYCIPTWNTSDSCAAISVYTWNETYENTIAEQPLATQYFERLGDCKTDWLRFDELPAGEYYISIENVSGSAGTWVYPMTVGNGYIINDGQESTGDLELTVSFTKTPVVPFPETESSVDKIDGNHVPPAEYVIPEDSKIYTHPVMPDTWVFTDALGRTSLTNADVGDPRDDKTLAIFYSTWHSDLGTNDPLNVNDFMLEHPDAKNDYTNPAWPKNAVAYFWDEPIYGYYRTNDTWVLRRQAELLADAGVDTIFTDNTNGNFTWRTSYIKMYEAWDQAMTDGVLTPKISYLLPFGGTPGSREQLISLYLDIFRNDKYTNLWYYLDGKPMLMAYTDNLSSKVNVEKEIINFFTYRKGQPLYLLNGTVLKTWGWLSTYKQALYYKSSTEKKNGIVEQMTVGVAVNHNYVTHEITAMNGENVMGRSYTSTEYHTEEGASKWGYCFSEQFDYALEVDPKVIFVTGWNEWTAGRHEEWSGITNAFPDQYNDEYSRDIEPSRGDLGDCYYYQLVNYVRKYKGVRPIPEAGTAKTIDIEKNAAEQWNDIEPYFGAYIGNTGDRDAAGYGSLHYSDFSGRNDIIGAQVSRDDEYVYFLAECNDVISSFTDKLWMVLYIDSDQNNQGWETFDYVINKTSPSSTKAVLEKFTGNGYASEKVADVEYSVDGKYIQIKVPKTALGLSGYDFTINFSWTDNVHDSDDKGTADDLGNYTYSKFSGDILDFYVSGDVAPGVRFKYSYISTQSNATGVPDTTDTEPAETTEETTQDETTPDTVETTGATPDAETTTGMIETTAPTDTDTTGATSEAGTTSAADSTDADKEKSGCFSAVGSGLILSLVTAIGFVAVKRKKE